MTKWSYIVRIGEGQNESQRSKGIRGSHGNLDKEQKKEEQSGTIGSLIKIRGINGIIRKEKKWNCRKTTGVPV